MLTAVPVVPTNQAAELDFLVAFQLENRSLRLTLHLVQANYLDFSSLRPNDFDMTRHDSQLESKQVNDRGKSQLESRIGQVY